MSTSKTTSLRAVIITFWITVIDCLAKSNFLVSQSVAKLVFSKHGMLKLFKYFPFCTEMKANFYDRLWRLMECWPWPKSLAPSNTTELFSLKLTFHLKWISQNKRQEMKTALQFLMEISQWEEDRVPSVVY